jgi:hypothetical protein
MNAKSNSIGYFVAERGILRPILDVVRVKFSPSLFTHLASPVIALQNCFTKFSITWAVEVFVSDGTTATLPVRVTRTDKDFGVIGRLASCSFHTLADPSSDLRRQFPASQLVGCFDRRLPAGGGSHHVFSSPLFGKIRNLAARLWILSGIVSQVSITHLARVTAKFQAATTI